MKIAITGANGFLGAHLARALSARGDAVRCLVRKGSDASSLEGIRCEIVPGDVTQPESLPAAFKGADVVFHLAGIRRGSTRDDFMKVNADAVATVGDAMVANGARRLVFCGSLAASGPASLERPRLESDPLSPEEWYGESKAEGERIAFSYSGKLEVTSCRSVRILGPLDHENLPFFKLTKRGIVLKILGPERRLSMVDVDDVVAQLLLQGKSPKAVGEAFFATSDETLSVEQLMTEVANHLKFHARIIPVPERLLKTLGYAGDLVSNLTGRKLPISRKMARQLLAPGWVASNQKARQVLGFGPKVSLSESIKRSADSYVAAGWI